MKERKSKKIKDLKGFGLKASQIQGNRVKPGNDFIPFKKEEINQSIPERFEAIVKKYPDKIAVKIGPVSVTYDALNQKANHAAQGVLSSCEEKKPGKGAAALLFGQDTDMIAAIMGVLKTGMFYVPLDASYPEDRLEYMLEDSEARVIVTNQNNFKLALKISEQVNKKIVVINMEDIPVEIAAGNPNLTINPVDLAYILYTSGSTGKPKGVMQNHRNVLHHARVYTNALHINDQDKLTLFSSYSFDAAKMDIYGALLNGATLCPYDIKAGDHLRRLPRWLREEGITIYHSIPTIYRYFTDLLAEVKTATGGFPHLRLIVLGGEAVFKKDVDNYKKDFSNHCIFINGLGPTESTVTVQYFIDKNTEITREAVPVGYPVEDTGVLLLTEYNREAGLLGVGEILFKSDYLALGYWKNPELTQKAFSIDPLTGKDRVYRTGDLGRRLPDGSIEYAGRKDFQMKISGYRIEPGEIESRLDQVTGIKKSIVVSSRDSNNDPFLTAYYTRTNEGKVDENHLVEVLKKTLPDYMVPSVFIGLEEFPLTPTGKIDRQKLAQQEVSHLLVREYVPPGNEIESQLVEVWEEVLKVKKPGITENFFVLGGNSLKAILLVSEIQKKLHVKISLVELFKTPTIRDLAGHIRGRGETKINYPFITADKENLHQPFPLTDMQMTYLLGRSGRFEMGGISTHSYKEFTARLDIRRLNNSLNRVIRRHPMLRTIILEDGEQRILEGDPAYEIKVEDLAHLGAVDREKRINKERERMSHYIFKTDEWPLFEIKAFKLSSSNGSDTYCLCIGEDRIIMDNFSSRIVQSEVMAFYGDSQLQPPALDISFRDYMMAYKALENSEIYEADRNFWLSRLEDFPPAPALPMRCNAADIKAPRFARLEETFTPLQWKRLKEMASKNNITPSALLCTVYAEVLAYWSNQTRFALNLTLFNRYPFHKDVNKIVGDFTSVILLAIDFSSKKTLREKAVNVRNSLLEAIEHRHYDGVRFIREISRYHNLGNKAVMPIVFTSLLLNESRDNKKDENDDSHREDMFDTGEQEQRDGYFSSQTSQAFIDYVVTDVSGDLRVNWNYVEDLFESEVIRSMFHHLVTRLTQLAEGDTGDIFQVPQEDRLLLEQYNQTREEIELITLHGLFSQRAKIVPHHTALIHRHEILTYKELAERSNRVACYLREQGLGKNQLVGLLADRSFDTIIHVMGILKAGAAYVPLDPEYPRDRIDYILRNSRCQMFLEPGFYRDKKVHEYSADDIENINLPGDLAYVIYTSGSTGRPKGVVITHGAAANTLIDINQKFAINGRDRVMAISSLCFDLSVYDVFGTLSTGAACVIIEDQRDIEHLIDTLQKQQITFWNSVPSIMDLTVNRMGQVGAGILIDAEAGTGQDSEETFYWSPVQEWQKQDHGIRVGEYTYRGIAPDLFPGLYFLTREGIALNQLVNEFPEVNQKQLTDFIEELVEKRVLVNSILSPQEIFNPRNKLFINKNYKLQNTNYKQITNPGDQNSTVKKFTNEKLLRGVQGGGFLEKSPPGRVSFKIFSNLLSLFKQTRSQDEIRYYFASAGGLYPIDIYIYIKKERVESMEEGLYYYNPGENALQPLHRANQEPVIPGEVYSPANRSIFELSAISIYMIYNADVTMPKYSGLGYFMASIDAGIMAGTLSLWSEYLGIGVCPVATIDFNQIKQYFNLRRSQVFVQAVEVGPEVNKDRRKTASPEISPGLNLKLEKTGFPGPHYGSVNGGESSSLLPLLDIFNAQDQLFHNQYSKAIVYIPEEYEKFKKQQLTRVYAVNTGEKIQLAAGEELPSFIRDRRSYRDFDRSGLVAMAALSRLLGVFKEAGLKGWLDYYYETAAGNYTIDIFIYVKNRRVENLEAGLYYYKADDHSLHPVNQAVIPENAHFPGNRWIFKSSAISIFMIYKGETEDGRNKALGYFKAGIHCGTAVAALTKVSENLGIGLCSIGNMDFQKIRNYFHLSSDHVFLHAVEMGLKPPVSKDLTGNISGKAGDALSLESHQPLEKGDIIEKNRSLRWVLLSGDWIPPALPDKIRQVFKHAEVISLGGATEGSIWSIYYPIKDVKKEWKSIPYGYPLANQKFYVLNNELGLCPVGVAGELYIGGPGVARGYINDVEKTRNTYVSHPTLGRIYKTGDHGFFRKDEPGHVYIEFLGRKDNQVKIRGYRVELGEIEGCLLEHPGVKRVLVVDGEDTSHKKYLCAYIVTAVGKELPVSDLRAFLAGKLPPYMVPSYFIYLEEIPLTPNGKLDRKALPKPEGKIHPGAGYAPPKTGIEKTLVRVCQEMFHLERIGIHDNFFDLGATSIDILQLSKKIKEIYHVTIPILKMFEYSTIGSFSHYLERRITDENRPAAAKEAEVMKQESEDMERTTAVNQAKNRYRRRIQKGTDMRQND
ncbi:MAG: amino acid adenylation domain-containing protein [Candidatus Aminicenantes bacterium]|jgi:amino acid adenylation domain-containing protein